MQKERDHPKFDEAHDAEEAAVNNGDWSFPGIGLPKDLQIQEATDVVPGS
jgi:hypothetical protein